MNVLHRLTDEQRRVVEHALTPLLVLAPPGSGKTEVLTQRVACLLRAARDKPSRILALTFTRKAADSLRARVREAVGEMASRVTASTFHAFCGDVLRHYGKAIGVAPDFTLYETEADRLETLLTGLTDNGFDLDRVDQLKTGKALLEEIGKLKRKLLPASAAEAQGDVAGYPLSAAYAAYDDALRKNGAVDFDDLLVMTHRLFAESAWHADHYRKIYTHILVDEAQDTSVAQYELLRALCGDVYRSVTMVADSNQSIYGFTGETGNIQERFRDDFGAEEIRLARNFRSAQRIIEAGNALRRAASNRVAEADAMYADGSVQGLITAAGFSDEAAEASGVVDFVEATLAHGLPVTCIGPGEVATVAPDEIGILGRTRYVLARIADELVRRNIPRVVAVTEPDQFQTEFFKIARAGLRAVANPRDGVARGNLLAKLDGVAAEEERALLTGSLPEFLAAFRRGVRSGLEPLATLLEDTASTPHQLDGYDVANRIAALAVADALDDEEAQGALDVDLNTWRDAMSSTTTHHRSRVWSLPVFLSQLALEARGDRSSGGGVRLMSVHAAKGLEFRVVVIAGMTEGGFPDYRSAGKRSAEAEELRLAYVAVTRAKRRLHLTWPRARETRYGSKAQSRSHFVEMLQAFIDNE